MMLESVPVLVFEKKRLVGWAEGPLINVKPARVAVPPDVATLTLPEVPAPTTAVIWVALSTVNEVAAVSPKLTAVAPVKLVPVIVNADPVDAGVGVNEVIVGVKMISPDFITLFPVPDQATAANKPFP